MIISPHAQRTDEWIGERLGLPTASDFEKILTMSGKPSKTQKPYLYELAGEVISGRPAQRFVTAKMKRAVEREPDARAAYEMIYDVEVREVGLCYKNEYRMYGYSPDGLINEEGILEIKDAEPHIQVLRFEEGWPKYEHWQQIQGGLLVTGYQWCDLMSYCEGMRPLIIRYDRDEDYISKLESELDDFCSKLALLIKRLR